MIIEIGKSYLQKEYGGNLQKSIYERDYIAWTSERIKKAFAAGNGTEEDLKHYMSCNKQFAVFTTI